MKHLYVMKGLIVKMILMSFAVAYRLMRSQYQEDVLMISMCAFQSDSIVMELPNVHMLVMKHNQTAHVKTGV